MDEQPPRWITYLELLDDYERSHEPGILPHLSELLGRDLDGRENQLWRETLNQLIDDGLISAHDGMSAASVSARFTAKGRQALADLRARRSSPVTQKSFARNGVLRWLYESDPHGVDLIQLETIGETPHVWLEGQRMPTVLFKRAADHLSALGFVEAQSYRAEHGAPELARLTGAGQELVESGRTLEEHMTEQRQPQGGFVTNIFGGVHGGQIAWGAKTIDQSVQTTNSGLAADELAVT